MDFDVVNSMYEVNFHVYLYHQFKTILILLKLL